MAMISKFAATAALAATLAATGLGTQQASAHDGGAGLFFGLASGLIIGSALAHERRGPVFYSGNAGYDDGPACYPGPLQWRWQQVCQPGAYGRLYCQNVRSYYRPEVCN
jgi:capsule polysaccharide modification protein KpsS